MRKSFQVMAAVFFLLTACSPSTPTLPSVTIPPAPTRPPTPTFTLPLPGDLPTDTPASTPTEAPPGIPENPQIKLEVLLDYTLHRAEVSETIVYPNRTGIPLTLLVLA